MQHKQSFEDAQEKQEEAEKMYHSISLNKETNERNLKILVKEVKSNYYFNDSNKIKKVRN